MNQPPTGKTPEILQPRGGEHLQAQRAEILAAILADRPLPGILEEISSVVHAAFDPAASICIYMADPSGSCLTLAAASGLVAELREALYRFPTVFEIGGPGACAASPVPRMIADISTHPAWRSAGDAIASFGLGSCWAEPILSPEGAILGVLACYHPEKRLPLPEELSRLDDLAALVHLAIRHARAREKLRETALLLRIAKADGRMGIWRVDLPEAHITWSDALCDLHEVPHGYSPRPQEAFEFCAPDCRDRIRRVFLLCLENGIPFQEELHILTASGRSVRAFVLGEAMRNAGGEIVGIYGATREIPLGVFAPTAPDPLAASLERITDAFFTLDREWRITYFNPEAEKFLGRGRSSPGGQTIWHVIPEFRGTTLHRACEDAMQEQRPRNVEEFRHSHLGRWFEIRIYPGPAGVAVHARDVTVARKSREQLRLLEACVSRINDIVIITEAEPIDEPGPRIVFVNDAFIRQTGYSREEALGRSPRMLQGPKTRRPELDRIRLALKKGEALRTQLVNYRKDGREIWLEIDIVPVAGDSGAPAYFVAVQRDISERRRTEELVRASEERYIRQRNSLIALTGIQPMETDDQEAAFRRITEAHARALGVARVGIWRYNEDRSAIRCEDLYDVGSHHHSSGMELPVSACPAYFEALEEMDVIAVEDVVTDPRTRDLGESYLHPLGIFSLLDAPIHVGGHVAGVLCSEHIGASRQWTGDEKTFAAAVANAVSLSLEATERRKAEEAVGEIQRRFEIVARATNDAVWDWDLTTDEIWWSEGFEKLFGYRREEVERSSLSWTTRIHPEDAERIISGIRAKFGGTGENWSGEYRFLRADGTYAYVLDRGFVMRGNGGKALRMVGGMSDISSRKHAELDLARLNRALKMLSSCNEAVTRAANEQDLLNRICRVAVETGGYRMAWVGYAQDDEERSIKPVTSAGREDGYLAEIRLSWDENNPTGRGPGGRSIRTGQAVVCENVEEDGGFIHWREAALSRGYRSVICLPLREGEKIFGLLGLYSSESRSVGSDEIKLLQELADDLAFGIGTLRARLERQRTEEVVLKVAQSVSTGTGTEFFNLLTLNMVEALGAHGGLIGSLNEDALEVSTLSFVLEGRLMDNVTYGLEGTPCENVGAGNVCIFDRGVQEIFPADHLLARYGIHAYAGIPLRDRSERVRGIMVVFFSSPLEETALVQSTLQIFAARAAAELDRQVADARIREQASLLDRARDAIMVRGLDHRITYWNKSAERLYGWSEQEVLGQSAELLLYRDAEGFRRATEEAIRHGEWTGELVQYDRAGRELVVEGRWTLLRGPDDQPKNILCINTDITEHKRLEEQFLRSQRLESIGTLAGGIAHDLNNVLAPISMSIELLQADVTSERGRELLATLSASARRGAEMLNQVLSFARGMEGRRVEMSARHLIGDVERIVRDTFPKNISLRIQIPRNLWTVEGDPTQLHQVLLNLCVNSRDAMPEGGQIVITAENVDLDERFAASESSIKPGPHILIRVEDTGHGIPAKLLDKIFEPFFTTKEVGKGTGLGLSTSLAIVKSHGGFIRAASADGRGSCFLIVLPARPVAAGPEPPAEDPDLPHGHGEMVLVVDDEPSIRRITRHMLESFGYRVLLAADGTEAVEIFRQRQPEVAAVVTDMMMPGMDGSATIRALAQIDPAVRIIAASGISDKERVAREAGACVRCFVAKPFTAETLLKALEITLSGVG